MPDYEERIMDENDNLRADYAKALDDIRGLRAELEHARNSLSNTIDTCNAWTDKYTERNTEAIALRAELADARHKMAQADIDTMHAKAELAAMTARKDGYRRVARKYREMWLVHFSGALMDQMGIEDPNDPDLKDEIVTRTGYASQARRILKILEARNG